MKQLLYCFLINCFVSCVASQDLHTVSIADRADFKVLRPCIHDCLFGNGDVAPGAGCGSPFYNQCWCSSINIAPSTTRYISTCIPTLCSDNVDVATGIDIYYDYCSKAGFPIPNHVARPVATSVDLHVVSIYSRNDFKVLRPCVTTCLYGNGDVAPGAGCGSPFYNQCWCSSNIAPSATSHISSYITNLCTDNLDVSTAVAIYYSYCSEAGHPLAFQAVVSNTAPLSTAVQTTLASPLFGPPPLPHHHLHLAPHRQKQTRHLGLVAVVACPTERLPVS
ncbi:hypothetical protein BGZ57DRAFT_332235 [Hyaloscypha finlandica]|nr:hypothetical protein BGZ57DRAFT_332235 [Hyaloscypha finlandica]